MYLHNHLLHNLSVHVCVRERKREHMLTSQENVAKSHKNKRLYQCQEIQDKCQEVLITPYVTVSSTHYSKLCLGILLCNSSCQGICSPIFR